MANCTDVVCQHLYCEIGKVAQVLVLRRGLGARYRRDASHPYYYDPLDLGDAADGAEGG